MMREPFAPAVVIVEDNALNVMIIQMLLRDVGDFSYLDSRASGRQLFALLDEDQVVPDLILMDIQIPREDGYTVLQQIRNRPDLARTRVVAVTAHADDPNLCRAREAGFNGFIGKPLLPDRFPKQIRRILRGEEVWEAR